VKNGKITRQAVITSLRLIPIIVCVLLALLCIIHRDKITIDSILSYAPDSLFLAFVFLTFLYAVKSLSVFFPMLVLNIVGGMLFPGGISILVNIVGVGVMTAIPYFLGVFSGADAMEKLLAKHKKLDEYVKKRESHVFFDSFFLRIISCLPGDIVSMYFGAARADFTKYFIGSMLGIVPGTITATLMGESIRNPFSPKFIISLSVTLFLSVLSIVLYNISKNKKNKRSENTGQK